MWSSYVIKNGTFLEKENIIWLFHALTYIRMREIDFLNKESQT